MTRGCYSIRLVLSFGNIHKKKEVKVAYKLRNNMLAMRVWNRCSVWWGTGAPMNSEERRHHTVVSAVVDLMHTAMKGKEPS